MEVATEAASIAPRTRTADPWRDTDVIDARAPRFNQALVGLAAALALMTGWWPLFGLLTAHLAGGLLFGRRFCVTCLVYFEIVQPRFGEGEIEDSRPPRFANQVGVVVLGAATVAHLAGLSLIGWALGALVAFLALLAAVTGLCVGCEMYRIGARLRSIRSRELAFIDPADLATSLPEGEAVVEFTHPLCAECRRLRAQWESEGRVVLAVDVKQRPDLARKYGVAIVPTAVAVDRRGMVTARLAG